MPTLKSRMRPSSSSSRWLECWPMFLLTGCRSFGRRGSRSMPCKCSSSIMKLFLNAFVLGSSYPKLAAHPPSPGMIMHSPSISSWCMSETHGWEGSLSQTPLMGLRYSLTLPPCFPQGSGQPGGLSSTPAFLQPQEAMRLTTFS